MNTAIQNVNRRWYGGDGTFGLRRIKQIINKDTKEDEEK